jgi:benzylsuccinate CoA-transferase BbsF subunit
MAFPDAISGIHAPGAALIGLWQATARPDVAPPFVEGAQLEATIVFDGPALLDTQLTGREPERLGNRHPQHAPQGVYPCSGEDRWLALTVTSDAEWRALCQIAALPAEARDWNDAERRAQHDTIDEALATWTSKHDQIVLMEALQGRGVIAAAVLDSPGMISDPHLRARDFWIESEHAEWGRAFPFAALPVHFDATPATYRRPGPALGEHNAEILLEVGFDAASIADLEAAGVLVSEPPA